MRPPEKLHWLRLYQHNKCRKKLFSVVSFFSVVPGSSSNPAEDLNKTVSGSQVLVNGLFF